MEVGIEKLMEWYSELLLLILVDEIFNIKVSDGGYEIKGDNWNVFCIIIQGRDLVRVYKKYKLKIFLVNVRDYFGLRLFDLNINNGICNSVENLVLEFWVYNNGVIVLVYEYKFNEVLKNFEIRGMLIVNGVQIIGVLGMLL